ncbi:hypothetical protein V6N12_068576 [Hibiscus sabdariffa]|uniref:RNase H type-1 domain-containing protein n=1 Tax=Hibiscus sabdariffa TaxID=183260 RepID=A0ABR2FR36_9ROSI
MGFRQVILESDSIKSIRMHVRRDENKVADALTKVVDVGLFDVVRFQDPPRHVFVLVQSDIGASVMLNAIVGARFVEPC